MSPKLAFLSQVVTFHLSQASVKEGYGGPQCQFVTLFFLLHMDHGQGARGADRNVWVRYVVLRMQY